MYLERELNWDATDYRAMNIIMEMIINLIEVCVSWYPFSSKTYKPESRPMRDNILRARKLQGSVVIDLLY